MTDSMRPEQLLGILITVFENKQFINFDPQTSVLTVAKPIWQRIDVETKAFIEASCEKTLEGYYSLLS